MVQDMFDGITAYVCGLDIFSGSAAHIFLDQNAKNTKGAEHRNLIWCRVCLEALPLMNVV